MATKLKTMLRNRSSSHAECSQNFIISVEHSLACHMPTLSTALAQTNPMVSLCVIPSTSHPTHSRPWRALNYLSCVPSTKTSKVGQNVSTYHFMNRTLRFSRSYSKNKWLCPNNSNNPHEGPVRQPELGEWEPLKILFSREHSDLILISMQPHRMSQIA
jgi:hypothetical protein